MYRGGGHNQLTLNGPLVITFTPSTFACPPNISVNAPVAVAVLAPNGGEVVRSGEIVNVLWSSAGGASLAMKLLLSTDGGVTYPTLVAGDELNDGIFVWEVPLIPTTSLARLRIEAWQQQAIASFDVSDAVFTVQGGALSVPVVVTPPPTAALPPVSVSPVWYVPSQQVSAATSIDINQSFPEVILPRGTVSCLVGSRIKGSGAAVYYCGRDGKRHAFPNQAIHDSWFAGFGGVITLSDTTLAGIPLGPNVLYRPGLQMIKIQTDPKVYALAKGGVLRLVKNEDMAEAL